MRLIVLLGQELHQLLDVGIHQINAELPRQCGIARRRRNPPRRRGRPVAGLRSALETDGRAV